MAMSQRFAAALLAAGVALTLGGPAAAAPPRDQQWYLDRIGVPQAHALTTGQGVLVGMFQSAVDTGDPDLAGRVRPARYVGSGGDIKPRPAGAESAAARAIGTGLTGLVVARGGTGPLGVAPGAEIQPINGPVGAEKVSQALRWLVDQGAKVIDMSGGFTVDDDTERIDGVNYALAKDVVVIVDARRADRLPEEATTGVLVVGGVTNDTERDGTASFGSRIDLSAPGATLGLVGLTGERSSGRPYGPIAAQGDLQACAITAGVVALVRARHPELNAASVIDRVLGTATDAGPPGPDSTYGAGVVDADAALTNDRPAVTANPLGDPGPPDSDGLFARYGVALAAVAAGFVVAAVVVLTMRRRRRRS